MEQMRRAIFPLFAAVSVFAQAPQPKLEFEVASIKPSPPMAVGAAARVNLGIQIDGAQVRCSGLAMKDFLAMAYQMRQYQISGPDWISSERFDIIAKLPEGSNRDQIPAMLQALLTERFRLKAHRDTKDFPVYGLVVAKGGARMKESPLDPEPETAEAGKGAVNVSATGGRGGTTVNFGRGSSFSMGNNKFAGKKLTMASFAETLARFVDKPVMDFTELKGNYDFEFEFTPEDFRALMIRAAIAAGVVLPPEAMRAIEGVSGDSLFTAVQTLGLRLESRRAQLEILVVDQLQRLPTEN